MDHVEQQMADQAAKDLTTSSAILSPLNIILLSAVVYTIYSFLRPSPPPSLPRDTPATVFRTYTPHTLLPFSGENNTPVYLAVRGRVFDVSRGRNFYGPGGPYSNFAGRDASRGLACGSFDEDMLTKDLDGPLDKCADLTPDQVEAVEGWEQRFLEKYEVVGKLVSVADYEAETGKKA
ncbi:cytochrome b5-like heme/steroid binding domain-containing protein [Thelonectria olida]|uniref:Cytochrome b5-like heme/steroid binding domain-containing protein n=1 Tax=Thelonectria olida TaxID=1576542 RepID=A0A9P8VVQ1_9HYPO|nr:cytochrome b5-like heme/steroid binding domain-containing protein [Thelonectria olida]